MEISAFLDRKLARRFTTLDADGNGVIERDDYILSATRLADEFGHAADSAQRQRMMALCEQLWTLLSQAADADGDGRITLGEYKSAFVDGLLVTEESFDAGYRPLMETIVAIADVDGDGKLGEDEYVRWAGAWMGLTAPIARDAHRRLDTDGDGVVTADTILTAVHDYYFDDTPGSVGSWFLGPLDGD
ncbi:EF-hand domain-containing protein [Nocardia sp. BMG51109]|uniref:EF-hand domain-containing protein n=1 Tax=Nocardia sp. BMG51109 TaxID=1056816 RepID=UPI000466111F|nr:EF-hand domain-containing protein [Nocardia sp. BMG51109]